MPIADALLPEFDHEMATTRKCLERMPEDQATWKPHAKSFDLGRLCLHLAELPGWATMAMTTTEMNFNPPGGKPYEPTKYESKAQVMKMFEQNVAAARDALGKASDADYMVGWTLKSGEESYFTLPRVAVVRTWMMNHLIHHRGQLTVYLRELGVPVPSIYGPSADEQGM